MIELDTSLDDFERIEGALHAQGVVVIPRQTLTPAEFVAFARRFGRPEPHVIDQFHHPAEPDILILSNWRHRGEPIGLADAGTYFHTDYSYLAVPARCTLLYAIQLPEQPAGTWFAQQARAWEDLPDASKARIDGLIGLHHYGNRDDLDERSRTAASPLTTEQKAQMEWVRHPIVRRHPKTGAKSLYAVNGSSFGIEGMPEEEALALLRELAAHSTQERYCFTHDYRVGDVMIWDNCQILHRAPLMQPQDCRTLWRITVLDEGPTV